MINESTIPIQTDLSKTVTTGISALPPGPFGIIGGNNILSNNMNHFLKLFTGRNTTLDLTSVSKDDITVLAQYKQLDRQAQKEVREFIKFKHTQFKKKK